MILFFTVNSVLGSRFKRVALPLGLMSAGASVCYPAQAVAVVKVTLFLDADILALKVATLIIFRVTYNCLCPLR